ncbi:hypothetical protein G5V58_03515 [Nocardioides anomalus]|uniref:Uncharacterized protein n=1 Tax=Nocardioides anomalus TaxID=2712223 RepID=A0A6G6W9U0_9ACTN|nr:hypothetical protein [Nocardioides anomalus]QIG41969.1 hypothetical protein G5V58_03515 [Nocardioides anomalus]
MNDLNTLLDRAAGPARATVDAHPDLTRGHRALARTRRRRGAVGLAGVAAAGAFGVALTRGGGGGDTPVGVADDPTTVPSPSTATSTPPTAPPTAPPPTTPPPTSPTVDPSAPVTGSAAPRFFALPPAPAGFELQGNSPSSVTIAPVGDRSVPEDFEGKIVLMFDTHRPAGHRQVVDGRTFWVAADTGGGYARVSTRSREGDPAGVLALQFPVRAWTTDDALAFLSGVRALDGAAAVGG